MINLAVDKKIAIGKVFLVDNEEVFFNIENCERLKSLKIDDLVLFSGSNKSQMIAGTITKIDRRLLRFSEDKDDLFAEDRDYCTAVLIGTYYVKLGIKSKIFRRVINSYPEINSVVYHQIKD